MFGQPALRIDEESFPIGNGHAVSARFYAIRVGRYSIDIREQRERQAEVLRELLVGFYAVHADAENLRIVTFEYEDFVSEPACFGRAIRSLVPGVEIQHDPLIAIVLQRMQPAVLIGKLEFGGWLADDDRLRRKRRAADCERG